MSIRNTFRPVCGSAAVELADELVYGPGKALDFSELLPVTGVEVVLTRFAAATQEDPINTVTLFLLGRASGTIVGMTKYSLPSGNVSRYWLTLRGRATGWFGQPNRGERLPGTYSARVENGLWTVTSPYGDVATGRDEEAGVQTTLRVGVSGSATPTWSVGLARVVLTRDGVQYEFLPRADQTGMYCAALDKTIYLSTV